VVHSTAAVLQLLQLCVQGIYEPVDPWPEPQPSHQSSQVKLTQDFMQ
jgi:hypothetical protein